MNVVAPAGSSVTKVAEGSPLVPDSLLIKSSSASGTTRVYAVLHDANSVAEMPFISDLKPMMPDSLLINSSSASGGDPYICRTFAEMPCISYIKPMVLDSLLTKSSSASGATGVSAVLHDATGSDPRGQWIERLPRGRRGWWPPRATERAK